MSSFAGETKTAASTSPSTMILLQPELISNAHKELHGITNREFTGGTKNLWLQIYSYLQPSYCTRIRLKCSCRLFNDVEKMITFNPNCSPLKPIPRGSYSSFPHPKYATLSKLMSRLSKLGNDYVELKATDMLIGLKVYIDRHGTWYDYEDQTITKINPDGTYNTTERNNVPLAELKQKVIHILPSLLFIEDGIHDEGGNDIFINITISIIGESREYCIVIGGLSMKGKKEDDVNVSNLTLRDSKWDGVDGYNGASMHLDNVSVENSGSCGVVVNNGSKRNTMKNCNVSHSKLNGLDVRGGLMMIDGNGTTIHHNCTDGVGYELFTSESSSSIHLASSLTVETISKMMHDYRGRIDGGPGTIAIVDNEGTIIETIQEAFQDSDEDD